MGVGVSAPATPLELGRAGDARTLRLHINSIQARSGGGFGPLCLQPFGDRVGVGLDTPQAKLHVRPDGGSAGLLVDTAGGATAIRTSDGWVSIGSAGPPRTTLDVSATNIFPLPDLVGHVAVIENNWIGPANVLALKIGASSDGMPDCNFITFLDGNQAEMGAVIGYGTGFTHTVQFQSVAADYAEAAPRAPKTPPIGPGRIVGVRAGQVSLATEGAEGVFVTTDRPIVLGNLPPRDKRDAYEILALLGQVPVTVAGRVAPGDLILASGKADGVGRAVAPDKLEPDDLPMIVGRAWEASAGRGETRVNALVGPGVAAAAASAALLRRQAREIERLSRLLEERAPPPAKPPAARPVAARSQPAKSQPAKPTAARTRRARKSP
jgi:hypothetical protein